MGRAAPGKMKMGARGTLAKALRAQSTAKGIFGGGAKKGEGDSRQGAKAQSTAKSSREDQPENEGLKPEAASNLRLFSSARWKPGRERSSDSRGIVSDRRM